MDAVCGITKRSARDGRHGKQSAIWLVWQGQSERLLESHIRGLAAGRRSRPRPGAVALRVLAPSRPALGLVVGGDVDKGRTHLEEFCRGASGDGGTGTLHKTRHPTATLPAALYSTLYALRGPRRRRRSGGRDRVCGGGTLAGLGQRKSGSRLLEQSRRSRLAVAPARFTALPQ